MRSSVLILADAVCSVMASLALAQTPPAVTSAPAADVAAPTAPTPVAPTPGRAGRGAALLAGRGGGAGLTTLAAPSTPEQFAAADTNMDGKLDKAEFIKTLGSGPLAQLPRVTDGLFARRDANMDGFLSREEYLVPVAAGRGGLAGRGGRGGLAPAEAAPPTPAHPADSPAPTAPAN